MTVLSSCNPFFVRCVKPNPQQAAGKFDESLIEDQLRYSGLLETVRIRKLGFPVRMTFEAFALRYEGSSVLPLLLFYLFSQYRFLLSYGFVDNQRKKSVGDTGKEDPKKLLDRIMKGVEGIQLVQWQLGKTKVFMKEPVELLLERRRHAVLSTYVVKIQRRARIFLGRRRRQKIIKKIKVCQKSKFLYVTFFLVTSRLTKFLFDQWSEDSLPARF